MLHIPLSAGFTDNAHLLQPLATECGFLAQGLATQTFGPAGSQFNPHCWLRMDLNAGLWH